MSGYSTAHGQTQMITLLKLGPISGSVNANNMQFYTSGVFSQCGTEPNHGMTIVGMDADGNWIVKNSWGPGWGMKGYITIKSGNTCGIAQEGFQPYF